MDTVGDGGDRNLLGIETGPQTLEHAARNHTVQLGHSVGALCQAQTHDGHVELARVPTLVVLRAQFEDVGRGNGGREARIDEVLDLRTVEAVDTGGNRGVCREHRGGTNGGQRLVPRHGFGTVKGVHQFLDALDTQEARVTLVAVEHLGCGCIGDAGERPQRTDAAHAQEQFLLQTMITAAAVEAVGHVAGMLVVLGNVGVQQQQRDPADIGAPDLSGQRA